MRDSMNGKNKNFPMKVQAQKMIGSRKAMTPTDLVKIVAKEVAKQLNGASKLEALAKRNAQSQSKTKKK